MTKIYKKDKFIYTGAGFPVILAHFPFKKVAGEEFLDIDLHKLDLFIAKLVLMKPALLSGKEIRFLRTLSRESLQSFGRNFDIAATTVKNWEDTGNISYMIDFVIRNTVATKLQLLHNLPTSFLFHRSLLELAKSRPSLEDYKISYQSGENGFLNDAI